MSQTIYGSSCDTRSKPVVLCLIVTLLSVLGCDAHRGKSGEQLANEFDASLAARDFAGGAELLRAYERHAEPGDTWKSIMQGRLKLAEGKEADALAALESIPAGSIHYPLAMQLAGQIHLRAGRLVPAEKRFLDAIRADDKAVIPRRELIYIYGIQLRRRELREVFADLSKVSPMSFGNMFHWCLTRGNDWEPQEIVDDMSKFLTADPTDRWSRIALARSLSKLGRRDDARKALDPLPADDPDAIAVRAQIALDEGDDEAAGKLLETGPKEHFDLAIMRARAAIAGGDPEKAKAEFSIALKLDPGNRDAVVGMARMLAALGEKEAARTWLDRSAKLDRLAGLVGKAALPGAQNDPELPRILAAACESVGYLAEAKGWWNLVATRNPLDEEAQSSLYRLNSAAKQAP